MKQVDWYVDFVSPYAYLASESLERLPDDIELRARPILFAGLLKHWQTKGPAEIAPMRRYTYRQIQWLADRDKIPLKFPPSHPFNPLKLLRLCIALGDGLDLTQRLFRFVWAEGRSADNPEHWRALLEDLGVENGDEIIAATGIKTRLRQNTEDAVAQGVFGVPSFVVDGEIFFGYDSIDFLLAYLDDPEILDSPGMRAADSVPH